MNSLELLYDAGMDIASWVRAARAHWGQSQQALGDLLGVTKGNISGWENGRHEPSINQLAKISQITGYKLPEELIGRREESNIEPGPNIRGKVPLISWVRAGAFCEAQDPLAPGDAEKWLSCPVPHSASTYCLRVVGRSMDSEDGYREGEILFVDPEKDPLPGMDVIVRTPDGDATFKRLKQDIDGLYLLALNPKWEPNYIKMPEGSHICGVVIFSGRERFL